MVIMVFNGGFVYEFYNKYIFAFNNINRLCYY